MLGIILRNMHNKPEFASWMCARSSLCLEGCDFKFGMQSHSWPSPVRRTGTYAYVLGHGFFFSTGTHSLKMSLKIGISGT